MKLSACMFALAALVPAAAAEQGRSHHPAPGGGAPNAALHTPTAVAAEHQEIHGMLERATREPGELGAAARALVEVLQPHFRREEEIAAPPLGLLDPLSHGPATPDMQAVLSMTDALERELPQMFDEHRAIGRARAVRAEARKTGRPEYVRLAETLGRHALQEEQILYPAAILVGRYVRAATKK